MLPDNALLDIFDLYRDDRTTWIISFLPSPWRWQTLTQVCRRWRYIVLGSPRRLDLRIVCTDKTPTRTSLDIWPPFPIAVITPFSADEKNVENLIAAIKHRNRVSEIHIDAGWGFELEKLASVMQEPFPTLRHFYLNTFSIIPQIYFVCHSHRPSLP